MSKEWKGQSNNLIHIDADTRDAPCILIDGRLIIGTYEDSHSTLGHKVIYGMGSENEDWESLIDAGCIGEGIILKTKTWLMVMF